MTPPLPISRRARARAGRAGFTLFEVITTIVVFALISGVTSRIVFQSFTALNNANTRVDSQPARLGHGPHRPRDPQHRDPERLEPATPRHHQRHRLVDHLQCRHLTRTLTLSGPTCNSPARSPPAASWPRTSPPSRWRPTTRRTPRSRARPTRPSAPPSGHRHHAHRDERRGDETLRAKFFVRCMSSARARREARSGSPGPWGRTERGAALSNRSIGRRATLADPSASGPASPGSR